MVASLYKNRFELFLSSQIAILFGSLIVPPILFENIFEPILFLINLLAGVLLISTKPKLMWFCLLMLIISAVLFGISTFLGEESKQIGFIRMTGYFLFYLVVTVEIIKQVWSAKQVNKNVIFGLTSGYISLGLIGFFICLTIELIAPGSFQGSLLGELGQTELLAEELMYFSFITLMTIGYGDILPMTGFAQKAAIFIGLIGQFYLVIITAVVVGKYIIHKDAQQE